MKRGMSNSRKKFSEPRDEGKPETGAEGLQVNWNRTSRRRSDEVAWIGGLENFRRSLGLVEGVFSYHH